MIRENFLTFLLMRSKELWNINQQIEGKSEKDQLIESSLWKKLEL